MSTPTRGRKQVKQEVPGSPLGPIPADSNRRADIEEELLALGITEFEYVEKVPLSDFDVEKSLDNQARLKTIDETVVDRYTEAWARGDKFPPVVAHRRSSRGKLVLAEGNHRMVSGGKAKVEGIDAYIIKAAPKTVAVYTMVANTKHGLPTNLDERASHAIWLTDNGLSQVNAAAQVGIPLKELQKRMVRVQADRRAIEVGILMADWESITQGVRLRLSNISTDEGFEAAVRLAVKVRFTIEETHDFVTQLNQSRSGRRQVAMVKELEEAYAQRIEANAGGKLGSRNSRKAQTPRQRIDLSLAQISATIPDDVTTLVSAYAPGERADAAKKVRAQIDKLTTFADALAK